MVIDCEFDGIFLLRYKHCGKKMSYLLREEKQQQQKNRQTNKKIKLRFSNKYM